MFKILAFEAISFHFFPHVVTLKLSLKLIELNVRKINNFTTFKERQKFR